MDAQQYTDGMGMAHFAHRPSGALETVVLDLPGRRAVARSLRAFPGQQVHLSLNAWTMRQEVIRYTWQTGDTLWDVAALSAHTPAQILHLKGITDPVILVPGLEIDLPGFAATYRLEPGDTRQWLAEAFRFQSVEELAVVNGLSDVVLLDESRDIVLTGWHFFYARPGDSVAKLESLFGCPSGWLRFVGRCLHPDPQVPMAPEVIAIPTLDFVRAHG